MTIKQAPAALAERLVWQFHRSGGDGIYTKPFSHFDAEAQRYLIQLASIEAGEVLALAYRPLWRGQNDGGL
jgi:hypothetical protein